MFLHTSTHVCRSQRMFPLILYILLTALAGAGDRRRRALAQGFPADSYRGWGQIVCLNCSLNTHFVPIPYTGIDGKSRC